LPSLSTARYHTATTAARVGRVWNPIIAALGVAAVAAALLGIGLATPHTNYGTAGWVVLIVGEATVLIVALIERRRGSPAMPAPTPAPAAAPPAPEPPRLARLVVSQDSPAYVAGDDEVVFNYQIQNASDYMATDVGLSFGKRDGTKLGKGASMPVLNPTALAFATIVIARLLYDRTDDPRLIISWTDDAGTHSEDRALGDLPPRRPV
jgi:hypothetical protein